MRDFKGYAIKGLTIVIVIKNAISLHIEQNNNNLDLKRHIFFQLGNLSIYEPKIVGEKLT